jgi:hypothetical protein
VCSIQSADANTQSHPHAQTDLHGGAGVANAGGHGQPYLFQRSHCRSYRHQRDRGHAWSGRDGCPHRFGGGDGCGDSSFVGYDRTFSNPNRNSDSRAYRYARANRHTRAHGDAAALTHASDLPERLRDVHPSVAGL